MQMAFGMHRYRGEAGRLQDPSCRSGADPCTAFLFVCRKFSSGMPEGRGADIVGGSILNFNVWLTPIVVSLMISTLVSILRRRASSSAIRGADRHCHVYDQAQCGLLSSGWDGKVLDCNQAFARMTGHGSREEMIGRSVIDFYADPAEREKVVEELLRSGVVENVRLKLKRKSGETLDVLLNAKLSRNGRGEPFEIQGTVLDFTEHCRLERKLMWQAQHDPLTGLPNRATVDDRLRQAVNRADRYGTRFALLCIDVDLFKSINDNYGHQTGDEFLRQFVARLSPRVRAADTFGRVGGDEFVIILDNFKTDEDVARVAKDLIHSLNTPLQVLDQQLPASISIGIAKYPKDATNLVDLRRRADHALYRAKELGHNQYQCYSRNRSAIDDGIELLNHLENGLKENLFELYYQPQVCSEGEVRGVEALLRFNHPAKGLLLPKDFITVAEKSGLLHRIGEWVIREACRQLHEWRAKGLPEITMAVNVSAAQLASADFPAAVERILREQGIPPEMLELEITESLLMSEIQDALAQVDRLKQIGVRIAVDDFGIGYSSLSYLHQLPIDVLKIDRQFVKEIATPQGTLPIVEAIICLANAFEIETVAEGIETEAQLTILTRLGSMRFQGYLFSKPMDAESMTEYLQQTVSEEQRDQNSLEFSEESAQSSRWAEDHEGRRSTHGIAEIPPVGRMEQGANSEESGKRDSDRATSVGLDPNQPQHIAGVLPNPYEKKLGDGNNERLTKCSK